MTDAPRISPEEAHALWDYLVTHGMGEADIKQALAAFLSARVPEPMTEHSQRGFIRGFNACIDQVLQGRSEGEK